MKPYEVLERAADVMDKRGKWDGGIRGEEQSVCALQAICFAVDGGIVETYRVRSVFTAAIGIGELGIPAWSDPRSHGEVTSTFRAVAAVLRAKDNAESVQRDSTVAQVDSMTPTVSPAEV